MTRCALEKIYRTTFPTKKTSQRDISGFTIDCETVRTWKDVDGNIEVVSITERPDSQKDYSNMPYEDYLYFQ